MVLEEKGLFCWDAGSNPKSLSPAVVNLTHPLQESGEVGHLTNSKSFGKRSRSITVSCLNLSLALLNSYDAYSLWHNPGTKILGVFFIYTIISCPVLGEGLHLVHLFP